MLTFNQVDKYAKHHHILKGISLEIASGEAIGIVGPNGAGKSTFLKLAASVLFPDHGQIHFQGEPYIKSLKTLRQHIGYIPQNIALFEELSVKDQLTFWKKAAKKKGSRVFIDEMIHVLGLDQVMSKKVRELSGGWKRKVNVATGLLHDPDIILLDEPTAGMDLAAKHDLLKWLNQLHQHGKTILIISHDWNVINRLCNRILIFQDGQLRFDGRTEDVQAFNSTLREETDQELKKILAEQNL
ncbi:MAG: ABC transporter ATP-binding protein [Bacillaceae bacterium]|nr:ABC transporter ATP-binding protein [Bacillaceae bacterium]